MYDLLFVSVPLKGVSKDEPIGFAPGPHYLKGYLKQFNFKVKIIDGYRYHTIDELIEDIKQVDTRWIGLSVLSFLEIPDALYIESHFDNVFFGGSGIDLDKLAGKKVIQGDGYNSLVHFYILVRL